MKTKHFFSLLALVLAVFSGCKKDFDKHLPETEQNSSGWGKIPSFNGENSCLDEIEESLISNDQRQLAVFIYNGILQHESSVTEYGDPVFEATLTEAFEESGNSYFNVIPLVENGVDSVQSLLFIATENGFFHYVFYPKSKALENPSFSADFEIEGETFNLSNADFLSLFEQCDCYLFCPDTEIDQRGPRCPWGWFGELWKNIKTGFKFFIFTHGFDFGGPGDPGDYTTTIWVGGGNGGSTNNNGSGYTGGSGGTPIWEFYNSQILQNYLLSCETAIAAQTGAGDGGNPGDPNDPINSPEFLEECQQFFAIRDCLPLNDAQEAFLYYNPGIREELGNYFLLNGCSSPGTCGDTPEGQTLEYEWLEYRRFGVNDNDAISLRQYQMRYSEVCANTIGSELDQPDKIKLLEKLRAFELKYFGSMPLEAFGGLAKVATDNGCYDLYQDNFDICVANNAYEVDGGPSLDSPIIADLVSALQDCFEIGNNSGPGFTHKITIYVDQPKDNSSFPWWPKDNNSNSSSGSDAQNVGHAFIGLEQTKLDGSISSHVFGFYPEGIAIPGSPSSPGAIKNNRNHPYDVSIT